MPKLREIEGKRLPLDRLERCQDNSIALAYEILLSLQSLDEFLSKRQFLRIRACISRRAKAIIRENRELNGMIMQIKREPDGQVQLSIFKEAIS